MLSNARLPFWALLILCLVLLALPIMLRERFTDGLLVDPVSYDNLRLAKNVQESGLISYDELSYSGRTYLGEHAWIILLSPYPEFLSNFLPLLFGILSFVVFYLLISRLYPSLKFWASIFLLVSTPFLYAFSVSTEYVAAAFFILLGFYLYIENKKNFAYALFFISGLFSVASLFFVTAIFLYYSFRKKHFGEFSVVCLGFVIAFLVSFYKIFSLGLPDLFFGVTKFSIPSFLSFVFGEFGLASGVGLFLFFMALVGIYNLYSERYKYVFLYFLLLLFLFVSFYFPFLLFYLNFFLAFYAAGGIIALLRYEWRSEELKFLTILIILCGALFSTVSFYASVDTFEPNQAKGEAMLFLKEQEISKVVFSDYTDGAIIVYAGKRNFLDSNFLYAPGVVTRLNDFDLLVNSTDLSEAELILRKYSIEYVWVDKEMKEKYFNNRNEKFLFLLIYSPSFVNLFSNEEVEIWWYKGVIN